MTITEGDLQAIYDEIVSRAGGEFALDVWNDNDDLRPLYRLRIVLGRALVRAVEVAATRNANGCAVAGPPLRQ